MPPLARSINPFGSIPSPFGAGLMLLLCLKANVAISERPPYPDACGGVFDYTLYFPLQTTVSFILVHNYNMLYRHNSIAHFSLMKSLPTARALPHGFHTILQLLGVGTVLPIFSLMKSLPAVWALAHVFLSSSPDLGVGTCRPLFPL